MCLDELYSADKKIVKAIRTLEIQKLRAVAKLAVEHKNKSNRIQISSTASIMREFHSRLKDRSDLEIYANFGVDHDTWNTLMDARVVKEIGFGERDLEVLVDTTELAYKLIDEYAKAHPNGRLIPPRK